jgi:hypothetical protein
MLQMLVPPKKPRATPGAEEDEPAESDGTNP